MALKLEDLGMTSRAIVRTLAEHPATRRTLADRTGLSVTLISKSLSRLLMFGLVLHPNERGAPWSLSEAGMALVAPAKVAPAVAQEPAPAAAEPDRDEPEMSTEMSAEMSTVEVAGAGVFAPAPVASVAADPSGPALHGERTGSPPIYWRRWRSRSLWTTCEPSCGRRPSLLERSGFTGRY